MFKSIFCSILVLFSFSASAGATLTGELSELWVNDSSLSNGAYIATGELYTTHCQSNNQVRYVIIDFNEPGMKEAYSMALAAFMSGKRLQWVVLLCATVNLKNLNIYI